MNKTVDSLNLNIKAILRRYCATTRTLTVETLILKARAGSSVSILSFPHAGAVKFVWQVILQVTRGQEWRPASTTHLFFRTRNELT